MNIHRIIRRHFGVRVRDDCLPIASRKGSRLDLADCWKELDYHRGAEIGVMRGDYSHEILTRVPGCHLFCIDPWSMYEYSHRTMKSQEANYAAAVVKLQPFVESDRCTIMRMTSEEAVKHFADGGLDFVFIDGDHTFDHAVVDIVQWSRKVRSGGIVAVHDYIPMRRGGVMKAVDAYTHCHHIDPWYVTRESLATAFWIKP